MVQNTNSEFCSTVYGTKISPFFCSVCAVYVRNSDSFRRKENWSTFVTKISVPGCRFEICILLLSVCWKCIICLFEIYSTLSQNVRQVHPLCISILIQRTTKFNVNNFHFNLSSLNHSECILQICFILSFCESIISNLWKSIIYVWWKLYHAYFYTTIDGPRPLL